MEEFRKFCASMAGAPEAMTEINSLKFVNKDGEVYGGANCLQPIAADVEKLNQSAE